MTINITDGLQHRWPLKNPNFEDTIQGNNLSLQSSGYQIIPGSQGGIFSSTGAYLSGPNDNTYFSPDGFTLSIFFRRDDGDSNEGLIGTFSGQNENSWLLWTDGQRAGQVSFLIDDENNQRYQIQPNDKYDDGEFHHCVVIIDGSTVKMFVDGDEKGSQDISSASFSDPLPNKPIYISAYNNDSQLDGDFYDARIYNRALSVSERQAIRDYHNRSSTNDLYKGLLGYWRMESLNTADQTPYGNDARAIGSGGTVISGQVGNAVEFNGSNTGDYLACGDVDAGLDAGTGIVSGTAWVKEKPSPNHIDNSGQVGILSIFDEFNFTFVENTNNDDRLYPTVGVYGGNIDNVSTEPIARGDWSFVYWEYDNNTDTAKVQVDDGTLFSGSTNDGGAIDELRLYDRKLSAEQRELIRNARAQQVQKT